MQPSWSQVTHAQGIRAALNQVLGLILGDHVASHNLQTVMHHAKTRGDGSSPKIPRKLQVLFSCQNLLYMPRLCQILLANLPKQSSNDQQKHLTNTWRMGEFSVCLDFRVVLFDPFDHLMLENAVTLAAVDDDGIHTCQLRTIFWASRKSEDNRSQRLSHLQSLQFLILLDRLLSSASGSASL